MRRTHSASARRPEAAPSGSAASAARAISTARGTSSREAMRRRLRQLEQNHHDWQEEVQRELRKQKITIETLRRDNEPLQQRANELRLAEATSSAKTGGTGVAKEGLKRHRLVEGKKETLADLSSSLEHQTGRNERLEQEIEEVRRQLREARKTMGGVRVNEESHAAVNAQVSVLENRLDQSLQKFNEVLKTNKELRDQIDTLRGEREVFDEIYLRLERELQEKKKEMAFIIEVSNIAYEERDNNAQVLANLKLFAAEEMNSFAETFKELDELVEEDRQVKEHVRARISQLDKQKEQRDEEKRIMKTKAAQKQSAGPSASSIEESTAAAQARQHEEAFNRIRQATDIPDLDELVSRFLHSEEGNFSLFSFVNDIGKEIEDLEAQRSKLLTEIDRAALGDNVDQQRREVLKSLEDRLRAEESCGRRAQEQAVRKESILRSVLTTVEPLFSRLDCDESPIIDAHGVAGLSLESLLTYLACIEARADEFINAWIRQSQEGARDARGPLIPSDAMQVVVDPKALPGTGEDADASDDDTRPLTREQLLAKARDKLVTKNAPPAHAGRAVRSKRNYGVKKL